MTRKKVALVGCGRIAKRHIDAINSTEGIEISVVCDSDEGKARETAESLGIKHVTEISEINGVDVISITTPSGLHPEHIKTSIEKSDATCIVCEKPIALTVTETMDLFSFAKDNKKILLPVYQNRYNPLVEFIRELIKKGVFGEIFQFNVNIFWNRNDEYFKVDWHGSPDMDGGILYTQASHYVDMLLYFFGNLDDYKGLNGDLRNLDIKDTISAVFKFKSGTVGTLNATISTFRENYITEMSIIGKKGTVHLTGTNLNTISFWDVDGLEKPDIDFTENDGHLRGHDKMYEHIVQGNFELFPSVEEVLEGIDLMEKLSR